MPTDATPPTWVLAFWIVAGVVGLVVAGLAAYSTSSPSPYRRKANAGSTSSVACSGCRPGMPASTPK